ncbi:MAG: ISLre2 family transposase [Halanaerobium sp.]
MNTIITENEEELINNLNFLFEKAITREVEDISDIITMLKKILDNFARDYIQDFLEEVDEEIRNSDERKKLWTIKQSGMGKTLITEFGEIKYQRTYFESKGDKGYSYLTDDTFNIERYQRIDKGLTANLIELSKEYSYQKSADLAVDNVKLSRQTVKNKIRELGEVDNNEVKDKPDNKKKLKRIYVEADEDHISLQDGKKTIVKLVYIHEGKRELNDRKELINPHYLAGLYKNTEELWLEVIDYIDEHYCIDSIENIYLAGDGAPWILEGLNWLPKSKYVLDRYHLSKAVTKATGHIPEMCHKMWDGLNRCDYDRTRDVLDEIISMTEKETKLKSVKEVKKYILTHWHGIEIYSKDKYALGCSAEGHVSHVLSARMSSRPLGWSKQGADQIARLRAFKYNGGNKKNIRDLLDSKKKERDIDIQIKKIMSKKKKRSLYAPPKETVPALRRGKVRGTYKILESIAF